MLRSRRWHQMDASAAVCLLACVFSRFPWPEKKIPEFSFDRNYEFVNAFKNGTCSTACRIPACFNTDCVAVAFIWFCVKQDLKFIMCFTRPSCLGIKVSQAKREEVFVPHHLDAS